MTALRMMLQTNTALSPQFIVGGVSPTDNLAGDIMDVTTSPQDVAVFMVRVVATIALNTVLTTATQVFHASVDLNNMLWQTNALQEDASVADQYWGFPTTGDANSDVPPGCYLDDIVSSNFPFTQDIFNGKPPKNPKGYTHREILEHSKPGVAPYTYGPIPLETGDATQEQAMVMATGN